MIESACLGLLSYLQQIEERCGDGGEGSFKAAVVSDIEEKECIDWLVPPMLQPRREQE